MHSKSRNPLSWPARTPSLAGNGLLERIRSTTFALLGATALLGLVMVAIMARQGVPFLPSLPIPGLPTDHEAVSDSSVAAPSGHSVTAEHDAAVGPRVAPVGQVGTDAVQPSGSRLAASQDLPAPPSPSPSPSAGQPTGHGSPKQAAAPAESQPGVAPEPASSATTAATTFPSSTTPPVASSSTDDDHGHGNAYGHGQYEPPHNSSAGWNHQAGPPAYTPPPSPPPSGYETEPEAPPSHGFSDGPGYGHGYGHDDEHGGGHSDW